MGNSKPQTEAEKKTAHMSDDEKRAMKVPSFYHYGDRILEIRESKYAGHLEDEMKERYGVATFVVEKEDVQNADIIKSKLQAQNPQMKIGTSTPNNGTLYLFLEPNNISSVREDEIKHTIQVCDEVPAWDVIEYEQVTDEDGNKSIEVIMKMEGVHANAQSDIIRTLECMASKPFLIGGDIQKAFNPERKRLDSIIAVAQKEYEDEQEQIKKAAMASGGQ